MEKKYYIEEHSSDDHVTWRTHHWHVVSGYLDRAAVYTEYQASEILGGNFGVSAWECDYIDSVVKDRRKLIPKDSLDENKRLGHPI